MRQKVEIRYGKRSITIDVPKGTTILQPRTDYPAGVFGKAEIAEALVNPTSGPSLRDLVARRQPTTVAVTISDITRAVPNREFMPTILETLERSGVSARNVTIVIGTGMHRPSTPPERAELLGDDVLSRYTVIDHLADDPSTMVQVSEEPYVAVNRAFAEADMKIVTGFIEPHFMAGFSGGRKGVCPALVDLRTIQRFHGYDTLADPMAKEGILAGNPCHETALEVARRVGVDFLFNVAINEEKRIIGIYSGSLERAHLVGCRDVAGWTGVSLKQRYDIVVTSGGGYPLDQTFYQTVKGMCLSLPALKKNGKLLIVSSCAEGLGSPEYTTLMRRYAGRWREFLFDIASHPERTERDQWELQMQCRVLERVGSEGILFFSDEMELELQKQANVTPILGNDSIDLRIQQTLDQLVEEKPDCSVAIIPEGPYTMLHEPDINDKARELGSS